MNPKYLATRIALAVARARWAVLAVAATYLVSLLAGMVMVHAGNAWALAQRDQLVGDAQTTQIVTSLNSGDEVRAALLDTGGNLFGALVNTGEGLGIIFPFPFVAYRGWVGGLVSVNGAHASRLADPSQAAYYLSVLVMQLIPFSLAGGAGVNVGIANFRPPPYYQGKKFLTLPQEALRDVLWIYCLVVPLFLVASLWEFASPWR